MVNVWIQALKEFNAKKGMWCLPKKGSAEHAAVVKIMDRMKKGEKPKKGVEEKPKKEVEEKPKKETKEAKQEKAREELLKKLGMKSIQVRSKKEQEDYAEQKEKEMELEIFKQGLKDLKKSK